MDQAYVLEISREALVTVLMLAGPALGVGLLVGAVISILQAATQVQEQTLTFVPKIIAIFLTILITASWMMDVMVSFTTDLFSQLPGLVR